MNKFTIFTIILSVSAITVMTDLVIRQYLTDGGFASVLEPKAISPVLEDPNPEAVLASDTSSTQREEVDAQDDKGPDAQETFEAASAARVGDDEPISRPKTAPETLITESQVEAAGFNGVLQEKHFDGKVYQLLDISNVPVESLGLYFIEANGVPAASITEIVLRDEIQALQLYSLLQNKTKPYIDLTLNETNAYGDRSFYINHAKKQDEAFLTVKIGNRIYGFAYVKFFHPEIKKLIQLLSA
ncbi:hypothetical protein CO046_01125 [Candidatus Peregrinibacteria bacterium CG_4_9_14_0_2_um_filter_53_11]|nr:MAG: hypothetical protein CO046_01125 [Candidatus Peregrinibacteria bacterium CG_4_9_14_0_2_um_filter_53_11]